MKSFLNENKLERKLRAMHKRFAKLSLAGRPTKQLTDDIERMTKRRAKFIYVSTILLTQPDSMQKPVLVSKTEYGPAIRSINEEGVVNYNATNDPPKQIMFH